MRIKALKELYSADRIARTVEDLSVRINSDYAGRDVVVVCILKGAFMFFSDLVRHLDFGPQIDFLRLSSYGAEDISSGHVTMCFESGISLSGRDVLVVEDIVDSGRTLAFLKESLIAQNVKSLRIAALVDKFERREVEVAVDYAGFTGASGFLVGYGLDYAERFRELPALYTVELDV